VQMTTSSELMSSMNEKRKNEIRDKLIRFRYMDMYIPSYMFPAIENWIAEGRIPGSFLRAVLENDLRSAVACADDTNIRVLPAYISFFYGYAPSPCWGSKEKFEKWAEQGGLSGRSQEKGNI
jgi:hypothetical protein